MKRLNATLEMALAGSRLGRIALHLVALLNDWNLSWHLAGIERELG